MELVVWQIFDLLEAEVFLERGRWVGDFAMDEVVDVSIFELRQ